MPQNHRERPGPTDHPAVTTTVTREMVQARTRELAVRAGRTPPHVEQRDYEQAMRELTGASELDRQQAILDSSPGTNLSGPARPRGPGKISIRQAPKKSA